jgi:hypothetical protein
MTSAGAQVTAGRRQSHSPEQRRANLRTALVMATIAAAFFAGIVVKYWLFD